MASSPSMTDKLSSLSSQPHTHGGRQGEPPPPVSAFLSAETALAHALVETAAHQRRQHHINRLVSEISKLDARWRELVVEIEQGRKELESVVREGEERVEGIKKAQEAAMPYPELLAYAHSLSAFTSAPPNMPDLNAPLSAVPGAPVPPFFPPFPNEEKMRRGRLNVEKPLRRLGENHSVKPPSPSSKQRTTARDRPGAHPYRHEIRTQQTEFDLDLDLNPDL
ncbi:vitamin-D-receptor interacting mediator subunit 4-domain-containing protein [Pisolithus croceorrhizus]|nr:vitamin-D-receptor interacting mediator subunit 4-domain-containing protein [Pisolithus croceorrhizus]